MKIFKSTLMVTMLAIAATTAAQDLDVQALLEECQACHGPGGVSTDKDIPSIAGKSAAYIAECLAEFKFYERHCPRVEYRHGDLEKGSMTMCDMSGRLNQEEVAEIGQFFESHDPAN